MSSATSDEAFEFCVETLEVRFSSAGGGRRANDTACRDDVVMRFESG